MDAYEIRLELLKMAQGLLMEEWHAKKTAIENVYFQEREIVMSKEYDRRVVKYPEIPSVPSSRDIADLASKFNQFVSRREGVTIEN